MHILNLTQHVATPEQVAAGVIEPQDKEAVRKLLTFTELPSGSVIGERAVKLADIAEADTAAVAVAAAMIGGAGYLMSPLEVELRERGIKPLHSFTKRVVEEKTLPDGSVKKEAVFVHEGFVGL